MLNRRDFLLNGTFSLAAMGAAWLPLARAAAAETAAGKPCVRIGLMTDLHYADRPPGGSRHYRETLAKLEEAAQQFEAMQIDCVVELGDSIDAADTVEVEKGYLQRVAQSLSAMPGQHHYVLGNHCVFSLTKPEFLGVVGQERSYYSFDLGGYHFLVLDASFRSDGEPYGRKNFQWTDANLPAAELDWLRADLADTPHKTVAFIHQRLDASNHYGVKHAPEVRQVLEDSGKVLAVLQGHYHRNDYQEIAGIHYCTLAAMVEGSGPENNAYAVMDILPGDAIRISGFHKQQSYEWPDRQTCTSDHG